MATDAPAPEQVGASGVAGEAGPTASAHEDTGDHRGHPTEAQYMLIALILAVITAIEVGISYAKGLGDAAAPMLLILAAVKFALVVFFFMHLRFDSVLLRRIFATGLVLALVVYFVLFFMLGVFTSSHGVHA